MRLLTHTYVVMLRVEIISNVGEFWRVSRPVVPRSRSGDGNKSRRQLKTTIPCRQKISEILSSRTTTR